MPFDVQRFERAKFEPRRERVEVDAEALASFFGEGEPRLWEVRGVTASELHRALEASRRQADVKSVVQAIAASDRQAKAVREALGLSVELTPGEIAKRLELLVMGSVSPVIELPTAVTIAEHFPIEFLSLTNKISELTGKGSDLVKPVAASQTTTA